MPHLMHINKAGDDDNMLATLSTYVYLCIVAVNVRDSIFMGPVPGLRRAGDLMMGLSQELEKDGESTGEEGDHTLH